MAIYWPTRGYKGRTFKVCVFNRWDFNFSVRCSPLRCWIGEQCSEIDEIPRKNNRKKAYQLVKDRTTVKQGNATTTKDRSGKCLTEEQQIPKRWTEYCSELYNRKANGDPSVLICLQTPTEDDHPILCKETEAAIQSLKKGKSAGVDKIPAELD